MLLFLLLICCCFASDEDLMGKFSVGGDVNHDFLRRRSRSSVTGQICKSPGGTINNHGDCVCCPGYSGLGCSVRNRCYDVSCANGGHCNPETGFCMCPKSFTGPQCEHPSCSFNGFYDIQRHRCVCKDGFAGADCEQCMVSAVPGQTRVCVPMPRVTYQLMTLPTKLAEDIVSGRRKISATLTYPGIYPDSLGHDGKRYGCDCRVSAATRGKRWISNGNLYLYNQTIVECIDQSTLSAQQMAELTNMWYTAYQLEQEGRLNSTWYYVGIVFIVLFGVLLLGIVVYCVVINYNREQEMQVAEEDSEYGYQKTRRKLKRVAKKAPIAVRFK